MSSSLLGVFAPIRTVALRLTQIFLLLLTLSGWSLTALCELIAILLHWPGTWEDKSDPSSPHEANLLNLVIQKSSASMGTTLVLLNHSRAHRALVPAGN